MDLSSCTPILKEIFPRKITLRLFAALWLAEKIAANQIAQNQSTPFMFCFQNLHNAMTDWQSYAMEPGSQWMQCMFIAKHKVVRYGIEKLWKLNCGKANLNNNSQQPLNVCTAVYPVYVRHDWKHEQTDECVMRLMYSRDY